MAFEWFKQELLNIMPNGELRLVRDPHRLGLDLWVVERKLPAAEHAAGLEQLRLAGEDRFIDQFIPGIGTIKYDCAPEWHMVHICKSSLCSHVPPQFSIHESTCYREPNYKDIDALRQWLFEFRNYEHSLEAFKREEQQRKDKHEEDSRFLLKKEIKASKDFRQLVYSVPGDGSGSTTERIKRT